MPSVSSPAVSTALPLPPSRPGIAASADRGASSPFAALLEEGSPAPADPDVKPGHNDHPPRHGADREVPEDPPPVSRADHAGAPAEDRRSTAAVDAPAEPRVIEGEHAAVKDVSAGQSDEFPANAPDADAPGSAETSSLLPPAWPIAAGLAVPATGDAANTASSPEGKPEIDVTSAVVGGSHIISASGPAKAVATPPPAPRGSTRPAALAATAALQSGTETDAASAAIEVDASQTDGANILGADNSDGEQVATPPAANGKNNTVPEPTRRPPKGMDLHGSPVQEAASLDFAEVNADPSSVSPKENQVAVEATPIAGTAPTGAPQPLPASLNALPSVTLGAPAGAVPLAGIPLEIVARAKEGVNRFEIRLDPPDLGRIDVRLGVDRHGYVTTHLVVERAETLDLLRRDAPQLQRALEDAGLKTSGEALQFSLRDQGAGAQNQHARDDGFARPARLAVAGEDPPVAEAVRGYMRLFGVNGGLDIRV